MARKSLNKALDEMHEADENAVDYSETLRMVKAFMSIDNPIRRLRTVHLVEDIALGRQEPPMWVPL